MGLEMDKTVSRAQGCVGSDTIYRVRYGRGSVRFPIEAVFLPPTLLYNACPDIGSL